MLNYTVLIMINIVHFVQVNNYVIKMIVKYAMKNHVHLMKFVGHGLQIMKYNRGKYFFNQIKRYNLIV